MIKIGIICLKFYRKSSLLIKPIQQNSDKIKNYDKNKFKNMIQELSKKYNAFNR